MSDKLNLRLGQGLLPIEQPQIALVLSIFGALFAYYTLKIIANGTAHIENNWRRSDIAIKKRPRHEIREFFIQRIRNRSFTELRVMSILFLFVIFVQVVLVAVSAWSLYRLDTRRFDGTGESRMREIRMSGFSSNPMQLSGMAEKIDWFVQPPPASTAAAPSAPAASLPAEAKMSEANRATSK